MVDRLRESGAFAFDTETTGLDPRQVDLCGVSFVCTEGEVWYVPVLSPEPGSHLDRDSALALIGPLLEDEGILKVAQNLKFDMNIMRQAGVVVQGPCFDTMIALFCW